MRALWSGSLSFGLINIPLKLYSASKARPLNFKLLEKHSQCEISYQRICKKNHKEVPYEDIVKGYEYRKGDYVVLTDEDFKKAKAEETRTIDIINFSDEDDIDPKYYEKPYYLEPDKRAERAYALLREALKRAGKVAIAKFVMKDKQHLAAIKTEDNVLVLNQLRFQDEIRAPEDLNIPKKKDFSKKEMDLTTKLIDQLTEKFKPEKFKDTYTEKMLSIINAKAKGKKPPVAKTKEEPEGEVFDLMAALKASLDKEKVKTK
jgi:DNA end-binding protein Ku